MRDRFFLRIWKHLQNGIICENEVLGTNAGREMQVKFVESDVKIELVGAAINVQDLGLRRAHGRGIQKQTGYSTSCGPTRQDRPQFPSTRLEPREPANRTNSPIFPESSP